MIFVPPGLHGRRNHGIGRRGDRLTVVAITEGVPVIDMVRAGGGSGGAKSGSLGPNCPGVITPGGARSASSGYIHKPG